MASDDDERDERDDEHEAKGGTVPLYKWGGEREGFDTWHKLVRGRCRRKGGIYRKIAIDHLQLEEHLEAGGSKEEYEYANSWLYEVLGKPLLGDGEEPPTSTAYTLFGAFEDGQGLDVLMDFKATFAGNTEEELEDLEDKWKATNFKSQGVTGLATFLSVMDKQVRRLNDGPGQKITQCKAFRRVLKQLPDAYSVIRQNLSTQLETLARREAADPDDPVTRRSMTKSLQELRRRLTKFSFEEGLEALRDVKSLLALDVVWVPGAEYNRIDQPAAGANQTGTTTKPPRGRCGNCHKLGHNAAVCRGAKKGKTRAPPDDTNIECFVCGKKGHRARNCPERSGRVAQQNANVTAVVKYGEVFEINQLQVDTDELFNLSMLGVFEDMSFEEDADELTLPMPPKSGPEPSALPSVCLGVFEDDESNFACEPRTLEELEESDFASNIQYEELREGARTVAQRAPLPAPANEQQVSPVMQQVSPGMHGLADSVLWTTAGGGDAQPWWLEGQAEAKDARQMCEYCLRFGHTLAVCPEARAHQQCQNCLEYGHGVVACRSPTAKAVTAAFVTPESAPVHGLAMLSPAQPPQGLSAGESSP